MNKKSQKHLPNFQDLYSWEDIKATNCFERTAVSDFCGYFPIALCAKSEIRKLGNNHTQGRYELSKTSQTTYTLRYYYALQVLYTAIGVACNSPLDSPIRFSPPRWVKRNESFMMLEESKYAHPEFKKHLWLLLEEIADSGEIKVSEGQFLLNSTTGYYGDQVRTYCTTEISLQMVVIIDTDAHKLHDYTINDFQNSAYCPELKTYRWDDIKHFYLELSLPQIELLNYKWMHRFSGVDLELFRACDELDLERVKHAVSIGANVNALSPSGNSALQHAIQFFYEHGINYTVEYTDEERERIEKENYEKCKSIVDYLLDEGADIDLFGYDGMAPVVEAYYARSYDMIKHLLERGANPNVNCYLTDTSDPDTISTLLELLAESYDEGYIEEERRIEQLVLSYGGVERKR